MQKPYGTWPSPISAAVVAAGGLRLSAVTTDGDDIYWVEGRPQEGGRCVLVRRAPDGAIADVTPPDTNVRTRVHEYGGGACAVADGVVYYANFADQRVYRIGAHGGPATSHARTPQPVTPPGAWRYADFAVDPRRQRLICVREDHTSAGEPINTLVSIPLGPPRVGHGDGGLSPGEVIVSGHDFYSTPRVSRDGSRLAWLAWRHPQMPWDGTELWVADLAPSGNLVEPVLVAGGPDESIYQPGWSPDGALYFVSDREGWWRLYRSDPPSLAVARHRASFGEVTPKLSAQAAARKAEADSVIEPVLEHPPQDAEFGRPQWVFGTATWACAGSSRLVVAYTRAGRWHLATVDVGTGVLADVATDLRPHEWMAASASHAILVAGSPTRPDAVVRIDLATGASETLRSAASVPLDPDGISVPDALEFPTDAGLTAHGFYYRPRNQDVEPPPGEAPPLLVISHGGPTAAAKATFDLEVQYWTSRGFAVVDVNYGGSSGYGRAYRERLRGRWGIVDVADVINAARYLSGQADPKVRLYDGQRESNDRQDSNDRRGGPSGPPLADPHRLIIRGGSAGGYTTLAALTFHPGVFKAGASYYGISDLEALDVDTHKFESRYSSSLIGPYPESQELYRARSPIHFVDRLACPLILFQGLEDKVVPPNQSQMMADALRAKGLPVAYLAFEGEQHGFRKAETIIRCLEAELYFYGAVFGFAPAGRIEPVHIENL